MAQLIKLQDYISRYEMNIYHYSSQFLRLKKERWHHLKSEWLNSEETFSVSDESNDIDEEEKWLKEKKDRFSVQKWLPSFLKAAASQVKVEELTFLKSNEETNLQGKSFKQVKELFREELYLFQLRWASSTLKEKSDLDEKYNQHVLLHFFLQQIPDTYLLLFEPVFQIKSAPVQLEILLIGPASIVCISILEGTENDVFQATNDRFWKKQVNEEEKKVLSPLLSLQRMSTIIQSILIHQGLAFPIEKVILAPNSKIEYAYKPLDIEWYDVHSFKDWHQKLIRQPSPLKHQQLKVAQVLLRHCETTAYFREAFESDSDD